MIVPMTPPPNVCVKPSTDEAVPATCPSGSIASALKFEPSHPKASMSSVNSVMNKGKGTGPASEKANHSELMSMNASSANCDSRRMPNAPTNLELAKFDSAINEAM